MKHINKTAIQVGNVRKNAWRKALLESGITDQTFRKATDASRFVRRELPWCKALADGLTRTFLAIHGADLKKVAARAREIESDQLRTERNRPTSTLEWGKR